MKKPNQLQKYLYRGYYQDGLWDIWLGLCLVILGIGFHFFQQAEDPFIEMIATFAYVALVFITFRGLAVVLRWAKKTYTHPRTGYVKYKPREKKNNRKTIIIRVGSVVLVLTLINVVSTLFAGEWLVDLFRWTVIAGGLAGALVWLGTHFEIKRYYLTASLVFLCGIYTGLWVETDRQIILFYLLAGGVMIMMGGVQLIHFLRTTKAVQEDESEGNADE
ncbi:MAG: hypothetical protein V2J07_01065 [Anaerolineae bacterium]|nr:hypothetical protein [Anaerolineae bacterium]